MARGNYVRGDLQDKQILKLQQRLSHYLKDYRYKNDLKATDAAKILGYATPKYSELESEVKPHGRFISSIDFLAALAKLTGMNINEFVDYLNPHQSGCTEKKDIYNWQESILDVFSSISLSSRKTFINHCKNFIKDDELKKLELILTIINSLANYDSDILVKFEQFIGSLESKLLSDKKRIK